MEIDKKSLENVLKSVLIFGTECEVVRKNNQFTIEGFDMSWSKGYRYVHIVEDSQEIVEAAIDAKKLLAAIKGSQKTVDLTFDEAYLTVLNGKRKTKIRLKDFEYGEKRAFPKPVLKAKFVLDMATMRDIFKSAQDIVGKNPGISLTSESQGLKLHAQDELSEFEEVLELDTKGIEATSKYSHDNLIAVFQGSGEVVASFDSNYPLHLKQAEDEWYVEFIVAPLVDK